MPAVTIESERFPDGFPDDSEFRLEWVADEAKRFDRGARKNYNSYKQRMLVWAGQVTGSLTRNLDPGKYVWSCHKYDPSGRESFKEVGEMLVGMTQEQWQRISHMEPRMQSARMTSSGVVYTCQFPGCNKRTSSKISGLLHESEVHYGVDLREEPGAKVRVDAEIEKLTQEVRRGPGRPRKVVETQ